MGICGSKYAKKKSKYGKKGQTHTPAPESSNKNITTPYGSK
jgi:hypothetical protein